MTGPLPRIMRPVSPAFPAGFILAEYDARHAKRLALDEATLPADERALAESFRSTPRRTGFTAGRLALHGALVAGGDSEGATRSVLRDERGRPQPSWSAAPRISIAHTRARAIAAVAPIDSCAAIGIDVEEVDEARAHAIVRMSVSPDELARVQAIDEALLHGPLALWCARESCVKAHALEVGWFGTALVATRIEVCDAAIDDATHAWNIEISFESHAPMWAHAWHARDAIFAVAMRR